MFHSCVVEWCSTRLQTTALLHIFLCEPCLLFIVRDVIHISFTMSIVYQSCIDRYVNLGIESLGFDCWIMTWICASCFKRVSSDFAKFNCFMLPWAVAILFVLEPCYKHRSQSGRFSLCLKEMPLRDLPCAWVIPTLLWKEVFYFLFEAFIYSVHYS